MKFNKLKKFKIKKYLQKIYNKQALKLLEIVQFIINYDNHQKLITI